ncbi:CoxG family protein [Gracilibacillus kekensis]|uniref:Carbon monoxide dehydrogenase subunit G n=1 Tax=Gracilibacillus kekensis TaxID=1027249 RepID=A0A1M7NNT6_9BACI|nr:SRPBCC family protein [Gracilibacillus kekensis]SHN05041.1 Carbon monoxide dehydrogenase subunit G [Gracilibacillus kekensis]
MPTGKHIMKLEVPISKVWEFVRDMNNWAPLVPGYLEHKLISERQSTWKFKGDIGIIQKTVALRIDIKEWIEPTTVKFNLTGIHDNIAGKGYFAAKELTENLTEISGNLDIQAGGMKGPMVNSILKSLVPKTTEDLTEAVASKIEKVEVIVK